MPKINIIQPLIRITIILKAAEPRNILASRPPHISKGAEHPNIRFYESVIIYNIYSIYLMDKARM